MSKLYHFQKKGVRAISHFKGRVLLADEMGLGKTVQVLHWLREHPEAYPALVICPATAKFVWQSLALDHTKTRTQVLSGKRAAKDSLFDPPPITIINYDILHPWRKVISQLKIKTLVVDESHYIKNRGAKRTKRVKRLAAKIPNMIALSGTPFTNRPAELFSVLNILRPDLYPSFFSYAWKYCKPSKRPWGWVYTGARNLKDLHRKLCRQLMIRRKKKNVLNDLPDKTRTIIPIELDSYSEYLKAKNDFLKWLAEIDSAKALRAMKAEALVKMGYLKRLAAQLKLNKVIEWVDNFLEETEQKIVLFAVHKFVIRKLYEKYRRHCVVIDGETLPKDRNKAVHSFLHKEACRVFVGNIKACGTCLTLTAASDLAFIELTWTPGDHSQAEDRVHRIGQKNATHIRYFVAKDTIEENLVEILQKKQQVLDEALDGKVSKDLDIFDQLIKVAKNENP